LGSAYYPGRVVLPRWVAIDARALCGCVWLRQTTSRGQVRQKSQAGADVDDVSHGMNEAQMLVRVLQHIEKEKASYERRIDELERQLDARARTHAPQLGPLHDPSDAERDHHAHAFAPPVRALAHAEAQRGSEAHAQPSPIAPLQDAPPPDGARA
jgi:hypothetical protein